MPTTADLLRGIAPDVEKEIRPRLQGFLGSFVRAYLPQVWVFETDAETATLRVEPTGAVAVVEGAPPHPDVTIVLTKARLEQLLTARTRPAHRPTDVQVVPHTAKGKVAFDQVRSRFGF